ncbi:NUDIX hydrolase [Fusibacter bizertensis]
MLIRYATTKDIPSWQLLAKDVADIFRAPHMPEDPEFLAYIESKIQKNEALVAIDLVTQNCMGVIGFSKENNRISWFGVFKQNIGKGIGSKLLKSTLDILDRTKEITVETFRDNYGPGAAARHVYKKFGFIDQDNTLYDNLGNEICKMVLKPYMEQTFSYVEETFHNNKSFYPMKMIREIHHYDLNLDTPTDISEIQIKYEIRKAARSVLLNPKGEVFLLHVTKDNYYKLPGGGIEEDEDILDALRREVQEEVGCPIEITIPIGAIVEYRRYFQQLQFSYAFLCMQIGPITRTNFTPQEIEDGFIGNWYTFDDAINLLSQYRGTSYIGKFISKRDSDILLEAQEEIKKLSKEGEKNDPFSYT